MSTSWARRLLLPATLMVLAGCASTNPQTSFEATRALVAGRHPGEVVWPRDPEARAAAEKRVGELLAEALTPEAAAEVALLQNPALRATLENLGIAQADLAQATRLANPGFSFGRIAGEGESQRTLAVGFDLVDWLVQPLRRKVALAELERARLEVGGALLEAVAEARLALVRYQAAAQLAERLGKIEEIERAAADYARALHQAGNLTALERANAEAGWAESRAELGHAHLELERRREAVTVVLGLGPGQSWRAAPRLSESDSFDSNTLDVAALEHAALVERLDLRAARWAVDVLGEVLALKKARASSRSASRSVSNASVKPTG